MKKMKKLICAGLTAVCLGAVLAPSLSVRADVLLDIHDSFYDKHSQECDYFYRAYTANSPDGSVVLYESPLSSRKKDTAANGETLSGNWHYTDKNGEVWCAVEAGNYTSRGEAAIRGWVRTSDCLPVPDHRAFRDAYEDEFIPCDEAHNDAFQDVDTVVCWKYPGSNVIVAENMSADWLQEVPPSQIFDICWRDPVGRLWGFIGYYYGLRNTWICLDDPSAVELDMGGVEILPQTAVVYSADGAKTDSTNPSGDEDTANSHSDDSDDPAGAGLFGFEDSDERPHSPSDDDRPSDNGDVTAIAVGGVAAVVVATLGLLWAFFIRKK